MAFGDKPSPGQDKNAGKQKEMVPKSSLTSANNKLEKLKSVGKNMKAKYRQHEKQLVKTAHHGGQHALTIATAGSLSYAEGLYGDEYMNPGGVNARRWVGGALLVGGLVAEGMGHDTAGGYVQAVGAGAVLSDVCSSAYKSGIKAKYDRKAKEQPAAPPAENLADKAQVTPGKEGGAAGVRRGPPEARRPKHRVEPDRRQATVPPHLRHLLRESHAA